MMAARLVMMIAGSCILVAACGAGTGGRAGGRAATSSSGGTLLQKQQQQRRISVIAAQAPCHSRASTSQTALRQFARLFSRSGSDSMPFWERIARIITSWTLLFLSKSLLLASPLYFRKLIEMGNQLGALSTADKASSALPVLLASATGLVVGFGASRVTAGLVQLVSELLLSPATTVCAEGLPLEAFHAALLASSARSDSMSNGSGGSGETSREKKPALSAIQAAAGGQDEGRSGFARRALDRGLRASNQFLYRAIFSLLPALVESLAVLCLICSKTSWQVGGTAAAVAGTFVIFSATVMKRRLPIMRGLLREEGAANGFAEDALSLAETVAAFGATDLEVRRYAAALTRVSAAAIRVRHSFSLLKATQAAILGLGACAIAHVTWTQALMSAAGSGLSAAAVSASLSGQLVLVQALFAQLVSPLDHVGQHFRDCVSAAEDMRELEGLKAAGGRGGGALARQGRSIIIGDKTGVVGDAAEALATQRGEKVRPPRLEVRNVSFCYAPETAAEDAGNNSGAGRYGLQGVSVVVPAGGFALGIVGPSGSGKSTLMRVLLGLESLEGGEGQGRGSGQLLIDGRDVTGAERVPFFSMVGQESDLFRGLNLVDNVRYGTTPEGVDIPPFDPSSASASSSSSSPSKMAAVSEASSTALEKERRALQSAAQDAQLHPLLSSQPLHWAAAVGPRGRLLSGGERQRVCLARALYRQELLGGILLMDEVTASLDAHTEALVTGAIMGRVRQGATAILVAHRLSSVRDCDLILVMRAGRVVERGTHKQLMRQGGWYAEAVRLQTQRSHG